jgi:hypothetical protein
MNAQDILLDENFDLQIVNGDISIGLSDEQSMALLVTVAPGHFKQYPFFGFNLAGYKGSNAGLTEMESNLVEQAASDNAVIDYLDAANGNIIGLKSHRTIV